MPDSRSSKHTLLVACTLAVKRAQLKTGGPFSTNDLSRLLSKAASLAGTGGPRGIPWSTYLGGETAFTGLAFDSNDVPGDCGFSLDTFTKIALQVILLLCSTRAVMFFTWKTTGTVTSKRPDSRLEVSMPLVVMRIETFRFSSSQQVLSVRTSSTRAASFRGQRF